MLHGQNRISIAVHASEVRTAAVVTSNKQDDTPLGYHCTVRGMSEVKKCMKDRDVKICCQTWYNSNGIFCRPTTKEMMGFTSSFSPWQPDSKVTNTDRLSMPLKPPTITIIYRSTLCIGRVPKLILCIDTGVDMRSKLSRGCK